MGGIAMTLPNCRLFLVTPGSGDSNLMAECMSAALDAGDIASLVVSQAADAGQTEVIARTLIPIAHSGDVAVLIENNIDLALRLNADGVEILAELPAYKSARSRLGQHAAIGANCVSNRHIAMELAEAGADYVRFDPFAQGPGDEALIDWWSQLFEIPCVAGVPLEAADIAKAAKLGADFVRPSDRMWTSPRSAADLINDSMKAIGDTR